MFTGPVVSALSNKYGCRAVTMSGGVVSCIAFILCTFSNDIDMLIFTYGFLGGNFIYRLCCRHTCRYMVNMVHDTRGDTQHTQNILYNICTMSDQRLRRWTNVAQMLYKCFVLTGYLGGKEVVRMPMGIPGSEY